MTPRKLIIIGAGGFGREVVNWASDALVRENRCTIAGFLDSDAAALKDFPDMPRILGAPHTFDPSPDEAYVCAIGDPDKRYRVCEQLRNKGATFITVVHPSAIIGPKCQIGDGSIVCPRAVLTCNVVLGRDAIVNVGCCLGHDVKASECTTFSPNCAISGQVSVGARAFFGASATVLPGIVIGEAAVVGAGSVVVRNVPPGVTVFGVPATRIASAKRCGA